MNGGPDGPRAGAAVVACTVPGFRREGFEDRAEELGTTPAGLLKDLVEAAANPGFRGHHARVDLDLRPALPEDGEIEEALGEMMGALDDADTRMLQYWDARELVWTAAKMWAREEGLADDGLKD